MFQDIKSMPRLYTVFQYKITANNDINIIKISMYVKDFYWTPFPLIITIRKPVVDYSDLTLQLR